MGNEWQVWYDGKAASPVVAADVQDALDWAETCIEGLSFPVAIEVRCGDLTGKRTVDGGAQ